MAAAHESWIGEILHRRARKLAIMRVMVWGGVRALVFAAIGFLSLTAAVANGERRPQSNADAAQQLLLVISARADFPLSRRISMGANKSVLVQFPFELRDVLVSSPDIVDAVVQSSNRVFLIGKKIGQANAFFFDAKGQQLLTLEINVGADLKGLDGLLMRYVPGSKIQVEMAGNAAVLSGTVRTPIDLKRTFPTCSSRTWCSGDRPRSRTPFQMRLICS